MACRKDKDPCCLEKVRAYIDNRFAKIAPFGDIKLKTINGQSILGEGDIAIDGIGKVTASVVSSDISGVDVKQFHNDVDFTFRLKECKDCFTRSELESIVKELFKNYNPSTPKSDDDKEEIQTTNVTIYKIAYNDGSGNMPVGARYTTTTAGSLTATNWNGWSTSYTKPEGGGYWKYTCTGTFNSKTGELIGWGSIRSEYIDEEDPTDTNPNWVRTGNSRCATNSEGNTGYVEYEEKDNNTNSSTYGETKWVIGEYNTTMCPLPTKPTTKDSYRVVVLNNSNTNPSGAYYDLLVDGTPKEKLLINAPVGKETAQGSLISNVTSASVTKIYGLPNGITSSIDNNAGTSPSGVKILRITLSGSTSGGGGTTKTLKGGVKIINKTGKDLDNVRCYINSNGYKESIDFSPMPIGDGENAYVYYDYQSSGGFIAFVNDESYKYDKPVVRDDNPEGYDWWNTIEIKDYDFDGFTKSFYIRVQNAPGTRGKVTVEDFLGEKHEITLNDGDAKTKHVTYDKDATVTFKDPIVEVEGYEFNKAYFAESGEFAGDYIIVLKESSSSVHTYHVTSNIAFSPVFEKDNESLTGEYGTEWSGTYNESFKITSSSTVYTSDGNIYSLEAKDVVGSTYDFDEILTLTKIGELTPVSALELLFEVPGRIATEDEIKNALQNWDGGEINVGEVIAGSIYKYTDSDGNSKLVWVNSSTIKNGMVMGMADWTFPEGKVIYKPADPTNYTDDNGTRYGIEVYTSLDPNETKVIYSDYFSSAKHIWHLTSNIDVAPNISVDGGNAVEYPEDIKWSGEGNSIDVNTELISKLNSEGLGTEWTFAEDTTKNTDTDKYYTLTATRKIKIKADGLAADKPIKLTLSSTGDEVNLDSENNTYLYEFSARYAYPTISKVDDYRLISAEYDVNNCVYTIKLKDTRATDYTHEVVDLKGAGEIYEVDINYNAGPDNIKSALTNTRHDNLYYYIAGKDINGNPTSDSFYTFNSDYDLDSSDSLRINSKVYLTKSNTVGTTGVVPTKYDELNDYYPTLVTEKQIETEVNSMNQSAGSHAEQKSVKSFKFMEVDPSTGTTTWYYWLWK